MLVRAFQLLCIHAQRAFPAGALCLALIVTHTHCLAAAIEETLTPDRSLLEWAAEEAAPSKQIQYTVWIRGLGLESPMVYIRRIIRDEQWDAWQSFQRSPGQLIPLGSVNLMYRGGAVKKVPLSEKIRFASPPKDILDTVIEEKSDSREDEADKLVRIINELRQIGPVTYERGGGSPKGRWNLAEILFEKEGIFSGRAWSWENFMPRLLTVSGLVLAALLFVESVRALFRLGARMSSRPKGRK